MDSFEQISHALNLLQYHVDAGNLNEEEAEITETAWTGLYELKKRVCGVPCGGVGCAAADCSDCNPRRGDEAH